MPEITIFTHDPAYPSILFAQGQETGTLTVLVHHEEGVWVLVARPGEGYYPAHVPDLAAALALRWPEASPEARACVLRTPRFPHPVSEQWLALYGDLTAPGEAP